jgi:hypothetical protein
MTEDQLAQRILENAKAHASLHGYKLLEGAEADFLRYAHFAAADLLKDPIALAGREKEIDKAFEQVIDEMIRVSKTIRDYPPGVIGEVTLREALQRLCPIFPFC